MGTPNGVMTEPPGPSEDGQESRSPQVSTLNDGDVTSEHSAGRGEGPGPKPQSKLVGIDIHDVHHFQGVVRGRPDYDTRSIASSLAVHDNESVHGEGEPAALETVEDEHKEEDHEEEDTRKRGQQSDDEALEEIDLGPPGGRVQEEEERSTGGLSKQASIVSEVGGAGAAGASDLGSPTASGRRVSIGSAHSSDSRRTRGSSVAAPPLASAAAVLQQARSELAVQPEQERNVEQAAAQEGIWRGSSLGGATQPSMSLQDEAAAAAVEGEREHGQQGGRSRATSSVAASAGDAELPSSPGGSTAAANERLGDAGLPSSPVDSTAAAFERSSDAVQSVVVPPQQVDYAEAAEEQAAPPSEEAALEVQQAVAAATEEEGVSSGSATLPQEQEAAAAQQLSAGPSEDDLVVWSADAQGRPQEAAALAPELHQGTASAGAAADTGCPTAPLSSSGVASFAVQNSRAGAGTSGAFAGAVAGAMATGARVRPTFPPEWEATFKGLVYTDGVDALGRPVVVVDADAVPPNMKSSALVYVKGVLEPLVNEGHYVLVFTAKKAKLPSMWLMGAYRSLPRSFRKNVQFIILVRPSTFLRAVLSFMRLIISPKAHRKIVKVESLAELSEATGGEVTVPHLGAAFAAVHEQPATP